MTWSRSHLRVKTRGRDDATHAAVRERHASRSRIGPSGAPARRQNSGVCARAARTGWRVAHGGLAWCRRRSPALLGFAAPLPHCRLQRAARGWRERAWSTGAAPSPLFREAHRTAAGVLALQAPRAEGGRRSARYRGRSLSILSARRAPRHETLQRTHRQRAQGAARPTPGPRRGGSACSRRKRASERDSGRLGRHAARGLSIPSLPLCCCCDVAALRPARGAVRQARLPGAAGAAERCSCHLGCSRAWSVASAVAPGCMLNLCAVYSSPWIYGGAAANLRRRAAGACLPRRACRYARGPALCPAVATRPAANALTIVCCLGLADSKGAGDTAALLPPRNAPRRAARPVRRLLRTHTGGSYHGVGLLERSLASWPGWRARSAASEFLEKYPVKARPHPLCRGAAPDRHRRRRSAGRGRSHASERPDVVTNSVQLASLAPVHRRQQHLVSAAEAGIPQLAHYG